MRKNILCIVLWIVALGAVVDAQQQYSGGQAVTQSGIWTARLLDGVGNALASSTTTPAGSEQALITRNIPSGTQAVSGTVGLGAGTAKIGVTYPYTSCGTTAFTLALQAMPTASTAVATSTTCPLSIVVSNTTGGALTYTISDNQGTPVNLLNAVTIQPGERDEYTFPNGIKLTSGIKVQASGSGLTYAIEGLQ